MQGYVGLNPQQRLLPFWVMVGSFGTSAQEDGVQSRGCCRPANQNKNGALTPKRN